MRDGGGGIGHMGLADNFYVGCFGRPLALLLPAVPSTNHWPDGWLEWDLYRVAVGHSTAAYGELDSGQQLSVSRLGVKGDYYAALLQGCHGVCAFSAPLMTPVSLLIL